MRKRRRKKLQHPASVTGVIDQKFRVAAALRAERSLQSWAMTETARPSMKRWVSGPFQFSFGYQRADLAVQGPAIYDSLRGLPRSSLFQKTIYTASGMSAIAGLLMSLLRLHHRIDVLAPRSCYGETRELMQGFGERVGITCAERWRGATAAGGRDRLRVLLLDSCVKAGFAGFGGLAAQEFDLVMFDTTCFWRGSSRIASVVKWALRARLPMALVRSHAKLDCLGIEYGRLGSIVLVAGRGDTASGGVRRMSELARELRDSVRLFGAAPIPAHFPPFTGMAGYDECSIARTVAIMRNSRRLHECLARKSHGRDVMAFQHGLYLALSTEPRLRIEHARHAAASLCDALRRRGLPVRHAGSFGFDFVAIEWFPDPISHRNVIRVAPGDVPMSMMDEMAAGIDEWWPVRRTRISPAQRRAEPLPCIRQFGPSSRPSLPEVSLRPPFCRRETCYAFFAQCYYATSAQPTMGPAPISSSLERPA
jgi:hypothetical protein